ncbi:unnamed protein product [Calypogeia fissa]
MARKAIRQSTMVANLKAKLRKQPDTSNFKKEKAEWAKEREAWANKREVWAKEKVSLQKDLTHSNGVATKAVLQKNANRDLYKAEMLVTKNLQTVIHKHLSEELAKEHTVLIDLGEEIVTLKANIILLKSQLADIEKQLGLMADEWDELSLDLANVESKEQRQETQIKELEA